MSLYPTTATEPPCPLSPLTSQLPLPHPTKPVTVLGIEGSANKVSAAILTYTPSNGGSYQTLSNPRKTYISPPGHGFLPRETSWHHQVHIIPLIRSALLEAGITDPANQIDAVTFTAGPGMGGPLASCAVAARTVSVLWNVPLVGVNHW